MPVADQLLEEYSLIRDEIVQLNGQAFTVVTGSLTINFAILSAMFTTQVSSPKPVFLPFIALVVLFAGSLLLSHKIRMAHRLNFFLQYYIQPRLKGIQWPSTYSQYRKVYEKRHPGWFKSLGERFVEVQKLVLLITQFIDIGVMLWLGNNVFPTGAVIILVVQVIVWRSVDNYDPVEDTFKNMRNLAEQDAPPDHP
jgi:hypothetical protein